MGRRTRKSSPEVFGAGSQPASSSAPAGVVTPGGPLLSDAPARGADEATLHLTGASDFRDPMPYRYSYLGLKVADRIRHQGHWSSGTSADAMIRADRATVVDASRSLDVENWLFSGTINRALDYILGPTGFRPQAKTSDPELNARLEEEWARWAESPEVTGQFDWAALQEINLREELVAGDTLHLKIQERGRHGLPQLQHVESERVASSFSTAAPEGHRWEQGVLLDRFGRHRRYRVCEVDPANGYIKTSDAKEVDAAQAIWVSSRPQRSSLTRALPALASGIPLANRLEDILTSEAIAWQNLARFAFALDPDGLKSGNKVQINFGKGGQGGKTKDNYNQADISKMVVDLGHALAIVGHDIKGVSTNRPNANIEQSTRLFVRLFGVPLGIPLELILLDNQKLNYSSIRALLLQAFLNFRRRQLLEVNRFCVPSYQWVALNAYAAGRVWWAPDLLKHEWNVPSWPWVDEVKEVQAWAEKIDRAIATQTEALASLAKDRGEYLTTRKQELIEAAQLGREIAAETAGIFTAAEIARHLAGFGDGATERAVRAQAEANGDDSGSGDDSADQNADDEPAGDVTD